jgi:hypothetical protein
VKVSVVEMSEGKAILLMILKTGKVSKDRRWEVEEVR